MKLEALEFLAQCSRVNPKEISRRQGLKRILSFCKSLIQTKILDNSELGIGNENLFVFEMRLEDRTHYYN